MNEIREDVRVQQLRALVDKAILETEQISRQTVWHPIMIASVIVAGTTVMVMTLSRLLIG